MIIVSTRTSSPFNADGQHDCAGIWALVASKDGYQQIKAAKGIEFLIHKMDGEFVHAYKVTGFHTERRDSAWRQGTPKDPNGCPKISIGIRFHLETLEEESENEVILKAQQYVNNGGIVQGCSIFES